MPPLLLKRFPCSPKGRSSPHIPIQEGDDLPTGAGIIGGECRISGPTGHPAGYRPLDSFFVIRARGHVSKGCPRTGRLILGTPNESDRLGPVAGFPWGEVAAICSRGNALLAGPQHSIIEVITGLYVLKGVFRRVGKAFPVFQCSHLLIYSTNRIRIAATSPRLALPLGLKELLPVPLMSPAPTHHSIASLA